MASPLVINNLLDTSLVNSSTRSNIDSVGATNFTTTALAKNGGEGYIDVQIKPSALSYGLVSSIVVSYKAYGSRTGTLGAKARITLYYWDYDTGGYTECAYHNDVGRGSSNATSYTDTIYPSSRTNTGCILRFKITNPIAAQTNTIYVHSISITVNYTIPTFTITLDANGGTCPVKSITRSSGSAIGTITSGANNPTKAGHTFTYWTYSNGRECTSDYIVTGDLTLYAQYTINSYTISKAVSPSGGGTVTGDGTYEYGKTATLTATPNTGYKFVKWNDGVTTASRTITVTGNATYTAYFESLKINKIFVGTSQPSKIFFGTSEVKEVYVGTTKVYG